MKILRHRITNIIFLLVIGMPIYSFSQNVIKVDDINGALSRTNAPVSVRVNLSKSEDSAAKEGCLGIVELSTKNEKIIPAQVENSYGETDSKVTFLMPDGKPGIRKFKLVERVSPHRNAMKAAVDSKTGQLIIAEEGQKVLQYNYRIVYEKDVVRNNYTEHKNPAYGIVSGVYLEEYYKAHPGIKKDKKVTTQIYAVPRSDYIHPLYGLNGEMLTRDWPDNGHPHHRGIFWAWPEVEYGSSRGDIYALQRVFARPTGDIQYLGGQVFAQIVAENLWVWEKEPIVSEYAVIRVYRATQKTRIVDLTIKLDALKDSVTIATRGTNSYGGLNVRLQSPESQDISFFIDKKGTKLQRAWSDFNGVFKGNDSTSGLMILQCQGNPEYPGEWREYPNLGWVQPTFPTPNTRYPLSTEKSLILRYRLIIHNGGKPVEKISEESWDAYHNSATPIFIFDSIENQLK